ncbi:hypothetical protein F5Y14DRAFT_437307 [Nemania sp. NC0429]|nr:hypothetical protein F5Y14DRAFT_437307 [Nemania sp. NC0429]
MHKIKAILSLAALAGLSVTAESPDNAAEVCDRKENALFAMAPTPAPALQSYIISKNALPHDLLSNPEGYAKELCGLAADLPTSITDEFASWGQSLLKFASVHISSYDALVTECATTGSAAASITSYLHSIVSAPERLCQPTSAPSITPAPTNDPAPSANSVSTSSPTGAAARPSEVFAGAAAIGGLLGAMALL